MALRVVISVGTPRVSRITPAGMTEPETLLPEVTAILIVEVLKADIEVNPEDALGVVQVPDPLRYWAGSPDNASRLVGIFGIRFLRVFHVDPVA